MASHRGSAAGYVERWALLNPALYLKFEFLVRLAIDQEGLHRTDGSPSRLDGGLASMDAR